MGFGAIITTGEKNKLVREDLVDCITEVRVEQFLGRSTLFAVRFQEDFSGGQPRIQIAPELGCGEIIAIAVKVGGEIRCLVRGPITKREWSAMLGGPGSWYEIRGLDRRVELDRQHQRKIWSGLESDAAATILKGRKFSRTCIQKTEKIYGAGNQNGKYTTETLNQLDTDEVFLRQIARRNNMCFWIDYDCRRNGLDPSGDSLKIDEIANLRSSPLRSDAKTSLDCQGGKLNRKVDITLRINVNKDKCQNVTAFNIKEDHERPTKFRGTAIDLKTAKINSTDAKNLQPLLAKGGNTLDKCNLERDIWVTTAGDIVETRRKASAALTDAGWFVDAMASSTAHMLGGVLLPHDEIKVEGLGNDHDGDYHVRSVTHVINAADHFMDFKLRRNSTGGSQ
jgi:hypothetical protein